jgi:hypothetical protein
VGGGEDGKGLDFRRGIEVVSEVPRDRPWQIMLTGPGLAAIDAETRQALERILELFTEVGGLVVQTTAGDVSVTRDFPSDYTTQVDRHLGEIFKTNPAVTGIRFLGAECAHTATPDDPHWSAHGKAYASIEEAAARGELTPEAEIVAYRRLAKT